MPVNEPEIAFVGNFESGFQSLGVVGEERRHLVVRLKIELVVGEAKSFRVVVIRAHLNAH